MRLATVVSGLAVATLALTGCSSGTPSASGPKSSTPTTTSSTTPSGSAAPRGLTAPGTRLPLGAAAAVDDHPHGKQTSRILIRVTKVQHGSLHDLRHFRLSARAKSSRVYYVFGTVRNVGGGNLSRTWLTLYGRVSPTLVVPPVRFGSPFKRCDHSRLPAHFVKRQHTRFCMVMLVPRGRTLSQVQWRSTNPSEPIWWPAH